MLLNIFLIYLQLTRMLFCDLADIYQLFSQFVAACGKECVKPAWNPCKGSLANVMIGLSKRAAGINVYEV